MGTIDSQHEKESSRGFEKSYMLFLPWENIPRLFKTQAKELRSATDMDVNIGNRNVKEIDRWKIRNERFERKMKDEI